ncbi:STAS domain-containing protein [Streptomyces sp. NPDC058122]|uniref:STAS domain-containing protein n=1 Tax=Streptomyces sp. NPDC058122 TaxID=3346349 RepID=UPI0036E62D42
MEIEKAYGPQPLEVSSTASDGIVTVTVRGAVDHASVGPLAQALTPGRLPDRPRMIVDLRQVSFMDSSGINALLATHVAFTRTEGWLRLADVPAAVRRTLETVGVDTVIPCYASVREALSA